VNRDVDWYREPQDRPAQSAEEAVTEEALSNGPVGDGGASTSDALHVPDTSTGDMNEYSGNELQHTLGKEAEAAHSDEIGEQNAVTEMGIDPAFALLRLAIANLRTRAKRTTAAAVKTEMQRLSSGGFNEAEYGHDSFRKFLIAAEEEGAVALQLPSYGSGQDAQVDLAEEREGSTPSEPTIRRIRPDIWSTFFDYRTDLVRVFDLRDHRAVKFPTDPVPFESSSITELRARFRKEPDQFLVIEPVCLEEQLRWMQEFTAQVEGSERPLLEEALREDKALAAFTSLVRSHSALAERWNRYRLESVTRRVSHWMRQHDLELDLYERNLWQSFRGQRGRATPGASSIRGEVDQPRTRHGGVSVESVRSRVSAAVARMPLSELLQLRLPVEYMLDR
jgi:hypothetical protein